jgi:hypothetical protein
MITQLGAQSRDETRCNDEQTPLSWSLGSDRRDSADLEARV